MNLGKSTYVAQYDNNTDYLLFILTSVLAELRFEMLWNL
jgi:hypothetical protein